MSCLEKLYKEEADKEGRGCITIGGKETISSEEIESFQNKQWF